MEKTSNFVATWGEKRLKGRKRYIIIDYVLPNIYFMAIIHPIFTSIFKFSFNFIFTRSYFREYIGTVVLSGVLIGVSGGLSQWNKNEKKYFNSTDDM
ncbi:MAG: hypothetical protein FH761_09750 [Firmicutes bacterium]|nr:hypothetical protein [Bacillota bacterium]